jgi:hypothetical protein
MNGQGAVLYYSSYGHIEAMAYALSRHNSRFRRKDLSAD